MTTGSEPTHRKYSSIRFIGICFVCLVVSVELLSRHVIFSDWVLDTTSELSSMGWMLRWRRARIAGNVTAYGIDRHHPRLGWVPGKSTNEQIGETFVNITDDGIRGTRYYEKNRQPEKTRIVVVGDSFTFGEGVNDTDTYPAQLESMLPESEVMNFAVHGYGIDQMTMRLESDGLKFRPDYVIYAIIGDDITRAFLYFRDYAKPKYTLKDDGIALSNVPIPSPAQLLQSLRFRPATLDLLSLLYDRIYLKHPDARQEEALARAIWNKTVDDVRRRNAVPIFLFLPVLDEMVDPRPDYLERERMMFSFCTDTKLVCFSARPYLLRAYRQGMTFNLRSHYEPKANRIIAEGLSQELTKLFLNRP